MLRSPERVLVVCPEESLRLQLQRVCRGAWGANVAVEAVSRADGASERLDKSHYDLVVIVDALEEGTGREWIHSIQGRWPQTAFVLLLPDEDPTRVEDALLSGADDYLPLSELSPTALRRAAYHALVHHRERSLRRSQQRQLYRFIRNNADGILILNRNGRVLFANPAAERLLGRTKQELLIEPFGKPLAEREGEEWEILHQDGTRTIVSARATPIEWEGESLTLVSLREVTPLIRAQEELRRRNEELRRVLRSARCLLFTAEVWEESGGLAWELNPVDEEAAQNFLSLELLPGESYHEAWYRARHPIDRARIDTQLTPEFLRNHSHYQYEFRTIDRFGNVHWLREDVSVEPIGEDRWRVTGVCTDITDLKEADEQLRRSEERFRQILSALPDMIFQVDAEGRVVDFIPGETKPLVPPEEFLGQTVEYLIPPEVLALMERATRDAAQTGQTQTIEYPLDYPEGERWFEARYVPDARGGVYAIVRDITQRRRIEEQLRTERDRTQLYLNLVGSIVVALDPLGRVTMINRKGLEVLGWEESQVLGKVWFDYFLSESHREPIRRAYRALIEGRPSTLGEVYDCPLITRDGTERFVRWHHAILYDAEGNPSGLLISGEDITELRQRELALQETQNRLRSYQAELEQRVEERTRELQAAKEEAERASRAKSEFLSRMSHELRTPLNVILGFAQLMELDVEPGSAAEENLQQILQAGRHLLQLIEEVLDLSRIEAGRLDLSPEDLPLSEVVSEVIDLLRPLAHQRMITINSYVGHLPYYVRADRRRLRQVVMNLLSNAIKYNRDAGVVTITASVRPEGQRIRLSVADTGPGIPEDQQGRLFEPFERLGAEESGIEGTGIGLVTSKQLIEAMGGAIGFSSQPGQGSTFWIDIPLSEEQPQDEESTEVREMLEPTYTILYIEDNAANIRLVERILEERPDIRLLSAPSAMVGIELAQEHQPDLILLDLNLPGMNGFEAYERLKKDERTESIPVVAVTARAMPEDVRQGEQIGFVRYLTKPIGVRAFLELLRELLPQRPRQETGR